MAYQQIEIDPIKIAANISNIRGSKDSLANVNIDTYSTEDCVLICITHFKQTIDNLKNAIKEYTQLLEKDITAIKDLEQEYIAADQRIIDKR